MASMPQALMLLQYIRSQAALARERAKSPRRNPFNESDPTGLRHFGRYGRVRRPFRMPEDVVVTLQ